MQNFRSGALKSLEALAELDAALCNFCSAGGSSVVYSEIQDDCSIERRQLVGGQLVNCWWSCLRSGEVLVHLLHKSDKIQALLSAHGCPLLPLQEGANNLDWCRLRSRFLGNWCNILTVMRCIQKKCPSLRLQCLGPGTGEAIVDGLDEKKAQELMLISLSQCLTLLSWQKVLAQAQQSGTSEAGSLSLQACQMQHQQQLQQQQVQYQHPIDFNNNAGQASKSKGRQRQQQQQQQQQQNSSQQKRRRQPQPKLDRLKDGARVTCVYDTTTEEATPRSAANAAVGTPAAAPAADSAGVVDGGADGDCSGGNVRAINLQPRISLDSGAYARILQHLDMIRSTLAEAAGQEKELQQQQPPCGSTAVQTSPVLQRLQQYAQQKKQQEVLGKQGRVRQQKAFRPQDGGRNKSAQQRQQQRHHKTNKKQSQKTTHLQDADDDDESSTNSSEDSASDEVSAEVQTTTRHRHQRGRRSSGVTPKASKAKPRPAAAEKSSSQKKSSTTVRHGRRRQRQRLSSSDNSDDVEKTDDASGDNSDVQETGGTSNARWVSSPVDPTAPSRQPSKAAVSKMKTQPAEQPVSSVAVAAAVTNIETGGNNANDCGSGGQRLRVRLAKKSLVSSSAAPAPTLLPEPTGGKAMTKTIQELIFRLQSVLSEDAN